MNSSYFQATTSFLAFKRIPLRIVLATALASVILAAGMYLQGQPLYVIVFFALLPWMPVALFEGLWKIKHYHWIAIFGVMTVLQVGHLIEHIVQVGVLSTTDGTLVCPPPVDNDQSAQRAAAAGLRDSNSVPINMSASVIVKAGPDGQAVLNASGAPVSGPPACGIFGQLDLEIVHLVWEMAGWLCLLLLLVQYPHNNLLWFSLALATLHTVEHLLISYTYFLDPVQVYTGTRQLWGTLASGNIVTAYPLGSEPALVNFYAAAGKHGLLAKGGMIGSLFPAINPYLPTRPFLHFYYNSLVIVPGIVAFFQELRRVHDQYLKQAVPVLTTQELVAVTPRLRPRTFRAGEVIVFEDDPADAFYVVSKGAVELARREPDGWDRPIATLHAGEHFGESSLLGESTYRTTVRALVDVEVLKLNRAALDSLMNESDGSQARIEQYVAQRAADLSAVRA